MIWNTKITKEKVLNDSVKLKMVLGHFGRKIKILHILYEIAYFDMEHQINQWGGFIRLYDALNGAGPIWAKNQNFAYIA